MMDFGTYVNVSGDWNVIGYIAWQHKSVLDYMANVTTSYLSTFKIDQ